MQSAIQQKSRSEDRDASLFNPRTKDGSDKPYADFFDDIIGDDDRAAQELFERLQLLRIDNIKRYNGGKEHDKGRKEKEVARSSFVMNDDAVEVSMKGRGYDKRKPMSTLTNKLDGSRQLNKKWGCKHSTTQSRKSDNRSRTNHAISGGTSVDNNSNNSQSAVVDGMDGQHLGSISTISSSDIVYDYTVDNGSIGISQPNYDRRDDDYYVSLFVPVFGAIAHANSTQSPSSLHSDPSEDECMHGGENTMGSRSLSAIEEVGEDEESTDNKEENVLECDDALMSDNEVLEQQTISKAMDDLDKEYYTACDSDDEIDQVTCPASAFDGCLPLFNVFWGNTQGRKCIKTPTKAIV